jgi:cell shape-determining protein MreC
MAHITAWAKLAYIALAVYVIVFYVLFRRRRSVSAHNDPGFWQWLLGGIASVATGLFGYHKYIDGRFDQKADKKDVVHEFHEVREELWRQRDVQAKIFDHLREDSQRSTDRHERLMERISRE